MKQTVRFAGSLVIALCLAFPVWGKSTNQNVAATIHNMSTSAPYLFYKSDNVDEVCVFCHTPHGGSLTGPLWNHSLPDAGSFTHYNSATLSTYLVGLSVSRNISNESLLCMSCHDGSVAVDHLINNPNSLNGAPVSFQGVPSTGREIIDLFGTPGPRIGSIGNAGSTGNLSDDHPISFSYSSVLADSLYAVGASKEDQLRPIGSTADANSALGWKGEGIRLFGSDARVECSSCHDPHVNYELDTAYRPFLIRPNTGSDLCLACHNK